MERDGAAARAGRIVGEWLPACPGVQPRQPRPRLHPHRDLANFAPTDLDHLEGAVLASFTQILRQRGLLAAFFRAAGLRR